MKKNIEDIPMGYEGTKIVLRTVTDNAKNAGIDIGNGSHFDRIQIEMLDPFEENRNISNTNIEDLAVSIYENGFNGSILVYPEKSTDIFGRREDGRYMIISGHRRVEAFKTILNSHPDFMNRKIPAVVLPTDTSYEKLYEMNVLYNCMAVPETPEEARMRVYNLVEMMKKNGIQSKLYDTAAKQLKLSERQVRKYMDISTKLINGILQYYTDGKISVNEANMYAGLSIGGQEEILSLLKQNGSVSKEEFKLIQDKDTDIKKQFELNKQKIEEQEKKIQELKSINEKTVEDLRSIRNMEQNIRRTKERNERLSGIIRQAHSEELKKDPSGTIITAEILSKISQQTAKLLKRKEKGQSFSRQDISKIKLIIKDLETVSS